MFEWLSEQYLKLIANYKILLGNPTQCDTVALLRLFTLTLFAIFLIKLVVHLIIFYRLRRRLPRYLEEKHPRLFSAYREAAQKVKLWRRPHLYEFSNERPLVFTIGSLKPAIFMASATVEKLAPEELEAVLVHELTHIKRHDNLLIWLWEIFFVAIPVLIVQIFAISFIFSIQNSVYAILGTLIFITMFKAFLWRRILFLRELSCDDLAVDAIKDPLILASSLINVWRLEKTLPEHRWRSGFAFAQTLLPAYSTLEIRAQRLVTYRRPWFKFFLGKAGRVVAIALVIFSAAFLWRFNSIHNNLHFIVGHGKGLHFCSDQCELSWQRDVSMAQDQDINPDRFVKVMNVYTRAINTEDYAGIQSVFGKKALEAYPIEKTKPLYKILLFKYGKIESLDSPRLIPPNQAIFTVHFERGVLDMQIALDDQNKISGLWVLPHFNDPSTRVGN